MAPINLATYINSMYLEVKQSFHVLRKGIYQQHMNLLLNQVVDERICTSSICILAATLAGRGISVGGAGLNKTVLYKFGKMYVLSKQIRTKVEQA
jgi:hypothetical protein